MKKIFTWMLFFAMLFSLSAPALAAGHDLAAYSAQLEVIEAYDRLYEKHTHDSQAALSELLMLYPSLRVVSSSTAYFDENGNEIRQTRETSGSWITFANDQLVYDSDWGTYIYTGEWGWKNDPELYETNLDPRDYVVFYTQDPSKVSARGYYVYCYDKNGSSVARYSSFESSNIVGDIAKDVDDTSYGAAFSFKEESVRSGRVVVPLNYTSMSTTRMMIAYVHTWSTTKYTGAEISIGITSAGIGLSWEDGVGVWRCTSGGVSLS